jgi:hypothetical protein
MRRALLGCLAVLAAGCGSEDISYHPAPQLLPQNIQKLSLRPVVNKTQQFGLEEKLTLRVRDEFLRDGRYPLVPEEGADGIVLVTLTRYILVPTQYDTVLTPTAYKLTILANLDFIDRRANTILWSEPGLEGVQTYTASTLRGGMSEEQAREMVWDVLSRQIVKRTIEGFGAASGSSQRRLPSDAPSTAPGPGQSQ